METASRNWPFPFLDHIALLNRTCAPSACAPARCPLPSENPCRPQSKISIHRIPATRAEGAKTSAPITGLSGLRYCAVGRFVRLHFALVPGYLYYHMYSVCNRQLRSGSTQAPILPTCTFEIVRYSSAWASCSPGAWRALVAVMAGPGWAGIRAHGLRVAGLVFRGYYHALRDVRTGRTDCLSGAPQGFVMLGADMHLIVGGRSSEDRGELSVFC